MTVLEQMHASAAATRVAYQRAGLVDPPSQPDSGRGHTTSTAAARREAVARLLGEGWKQVSISRLLGVSEGLIARDKQILKQKGVIR